MTLGPVMLDVEGLTLTPDERVLLAHPKVGGVILFSRNYRDPSQLTALVSEIHALRAPQLLVAVDHEGGRVQRFRDGFTPLPPAAALGALHEREPREAVALALEAGWLMAAELRACGVDMSFAPVLDLDGVRSQVIGDRAFHPDPDVVTALARAYVRGMREGGMAAVGKHFPGHGGVAEDSHHTLPVDLRDLESFRVQDMVPFERLSVDGLAGVMTAHLKIPRVDDVPVSFSRRWLRGVLRGDLGYRGAVFSDDLSMHGALGAGSPLQRAEAALAAGCDMVLICNDPQAARDAVMGLGEDADAAVRGSRLARFHGRGHLSPSELSLSPRHASAVARLARLNPAPELDLHDDNPA